MQLVARLLKVSLLAMVMSLDFGKSVTLNSLPGVISVNSPWQ